MKFGPIALGMATGLALASSPATAATTIGGGLVFGAPSGINYFDSLGGFVPAGYGNENGFLVPISNGIEFGFEDPINLDTADFTENSLTITNVTKPSKAQDQVIAFMVFSSSVAGFFDNARFITNTFGATFRVRNNMLIFSAPSTSVIGTRVATISFVAPAASATAAVPEPATWAMMIAGFGLVGGALRRRAAPAVRVTYA